MDRESQADRQFKDRFKKKKKRKTTYGLDSCFIPHGSILGRDCVKINGSVIHKLQSHDIHLPFPLLIYVYYFSSLLS